MPPQPNPSDNDSLFKHYAFAQWFMQFPALTVMVWLRFDLGFRILNPLILLLTTGGLVVASILTMPYVAETNADAVPSYSLVVFAVLTFLIGVAQWIRRWIELNRGVKQHSFYVGTSPFQFTWLPGFLRRNRRMARFVDPVFCVVIGVLLVPYLRPLGCYLVFAGICLRTYEFYVFRRYRQRDLDLQDSLIIAEVHSQKVEQLDEPASPQTQRKSSGLPTGLGADIQANLKRRKK